MVKDAFLVALLNNIETFIIHEKDQTLATIEKLREEKQKVQPENVRRDELKKRIADMDNFLRKQPTAIIEYDEPLVWRLIEKVTIHKDKFTVESSQV